MCGRVHENIPAVRMVANRRGVASGFVAGAGSGFRRLGGGRIGRDVGLEDHEGGVRGIVFRGGPEAEEELFRFGRVFGFVAPVSDVGEAFQDGRRRKRIPQTLPS